MTKCLICSLDQHPFLAFGNDAEACSFCWYHEINQKFDERNRIKELVLHIKKTQKSSRYDCVVPVKGDAEDYFVLELILSNGLNPLVVHCNSYFQNDIGWHNYHNLITQFDVDSRTYNPYFPSYREFVAHALRRVGDIQLPIRLLRHRYAFETAMDLDISFVIYGKCDPAHYVGKFPHESNLNISNWWIREHELNGDSISAVVSSGGQITEKRLKDYEFPDIRNPNKPVGLFLENYMQWNQIKFNKKALNYGYIPEKQKNTMDWLENSGSSVYYQFHDLMRFKKFNSSKVDDHFRLFKIYGHTEPDDLEPSHYRYYDVNKVKDFFFNFLGSTTSGYEWYFENKLKDVQHLIGSEGFEQIDRYVSQEILLAAEESTNHFILYEKGI